MLFLSASPINALANVDVTGKTGNIEAQRPANPSE